MASFPAEPLSPSLQNNKDRVQHQHSLPHGGPLPRQTLAAALRSRLPPRGRTEASLCFPLLRGNTDGSNLTPKGPGNPVLASDRWLSPTTSRPLFDVFKWMLLKGKTKKKVCLLKR